MKYKVLTVPIAFNEEKKIGSVIDRFHHNSVLEFTDLVVFNDGSTDKTVEIIKSKGVETIGHSKRKGVGASIRSAICYAKERDYEIIVIMAGNDKDRPSEILSLVKPIIENDYVLVQGSRYLPGGQFGKMPLYRQIATKYIHPFLFSLITDCKITDSTNGFRAIRLSIIDDKRIDLNQKWLDKYELEIYLLYKTIKLNYRFKEEPVTKIYPDKKLGYTKMKPIIGWWSMLRPIFLLGLRLKK